jgi:hypothetical protein
MVTSASAATTGGGAVSEVRVEGALGLHFATATGDTPIRVAGRVKASGEPDYASVSASLSGETELSQRHLTLSAFAGFGRDTVSPPKPPPGQGAFWPGTHARFTAGVTLSQIVSPRIVIGAGLAGTLQEGALASPYRRAIVKTSLFPEVVPGSRARVTAFASLSFAVHSRVALHTRQGLYADDWGVLAWVPEAAFVFDVVRGGRALVTTRYRMYAQTAAWFYKARYLKIEDIMTGDMRLGPIREHAAGLGVQWTILGNRGDFGSLTAEAGYDVSLLDQTSLSTDSIVGHMPAVGVILSY